ncbi:TPA: hypothetical protein PXQ90_002027 [Yersinia enterocolitica]|nr:hypothetical protein [Yersinia enterocolitica]HDL8322250.1 hypothetical protein [Yersinia enterocolitica]
MNNIEELNIEYLKINARSVANGVAAISSKWAGETILALISQLEAVQKERDVYANLASDVGDIITLLQNNEWAEHVGKTNVGGLLEHQITRLINSIADINTKLLAAEAALSAASDKLSKPVVLPDDGLEDCINMWPDNWRNDFDTGYNFGIWRCEQNIKAAGFTVEGE